MQKDLAMVVQHNLSAMNSNRQLGITTGLQARSSEKLSSGYKINRAADDAAGLAISEKMRRQVRGLTQASANVQDGVSYVQVADGALNEIDTMLARMKELCVKAANDTLDAQDRAYIDEEIQALKKESNRTFKTTSFNDKLIWDTNTTERKAVDTEMRPVFTWSNNGYYYENITDTNKGAWPANGTIKFAADANGVKLQWTGYDGVNYESKKIAWPSEKVLKEDGFTIALNSETMDYTTYPNALGIEPNLKLYMDQDATISLLASQLNSGGIHASTAYSISGTVFGDNNSYISGTLNYNAGLISGRSTGNTTDSDHIVGASTNRASSDLSNMSFSFTFTKDANTSPSTPSTFSVTGSSTQSVSTTSSDRRASVENVWWYRNNGTIYSRSESFSSSDLETAIRNALNGTSSNNSLVRDSESGGVLSINFQLKSDDAVKYTNGSSSGTVLENAGSFAINMRVSASETTDQVMQRIANISGVDLQTSPSTQMSMFNYQAGEFEGNIYEATMRLNIQAGTETEDPNVIQLVYDVLDNYSLGINNLNTLSRESALDGIEKVGKAAQIVDEQRSVFGAYQNRMEHAVRNLDNTMENTQSSESIIRDTDMAAEMVKYSNNNILAQAGDSILAQANQTNQGVLALLQ